MYKKRKHWYLENLRSYELDFTAIRFGNILFLLVTIINEMIKNLFSKCLKKPIPKHIKIKVESRSFQRITSQLHNYLQLSTIFLFLRILQKFNFFGKLSNLWQSFPVY